MRKDWPVNEYCLASQMFLDFEISLAFRLTQPQHLLGEIGYITSVAATLGSGNIAC
jgi:hypothetical protein